jgi:predicted TIM-barrel fold metal-dependent hydrolase
MLIDAHMHVDLNGFSPEKILQYLSDNNIQKAWFLSWEDINPPIENISRHLPIDRILEVYNMKKDRVIPFYAPDPRRENLCELLHFYKSQGVKGCGELKIAMEWNNPKVHKLLKCINQLNFPLIFHMEKGRYHYVSESNSWLSNKLEKLMNDAFNGISRHYIEQFIKNTGFFEKQFNNHLVYFPGYFSDFLLLERALQQYPDVSFIAHGPTFWKNISAFPSDYKYFDKGKIKEEGLACKLLEEYKNLYADISGKSGYNALSRDREFTKHFLEKYYHKLLYGTDNFMFNQKAFIDSFSLPDYKASCLFYKNAEKLIN